MLFKNSEISVKLLKNECIFIQTKESKRIHLEHYPSVVLKITKKSQSFFESTTNKTTINKNATQVRNFRQKFTDNKPVI